LESIVVYDPAGKSVKALGPQHRKGDRGAGHGIAIRKEGGEEFLYLWPNDSSMAFTKMTMSGEIVWQKGLADLRSETGHYTGKARYRPTNISFSPDGNCYLGDGYGSGLILRYDKDGNIFVAEWVSGGPLTKLRKVGLHGKPSKWDGKPFRPLPDAHHAVILSTPNQA
jgi:hypothetical protein